MNDFSEMRCALKTLVENALESSFRDDAIPSHLAEAMRYSLLAGGKRLRPVLNLASALACAESSPGFAESDAERLLKAVLPFASGLEMIHTYSLIHDDLPAMDDDDLRRGRPTCHRAFDEGTAILAGDALLTDAFGFMARASLPAERVLEALALAADAAGAAGMAGGQMLDLDGEGGTLSEAELTELNAKKTGALLRLACESGAVLSGADPARRAALRRYGEELGIAFQITDDILDVTGDAATLGKNAGHDAQQAKATWPSLLGLDQARTRALAHSRAARLVCGCIVGVRAYLPPRQKGRGFGAKVIQLSSAKLLQKFQFVFQCLFQHRPGIPAGGRAQAEILVLQHGVQQDFGPVGALGKQGAFKGGHRAGQPGSICRQSRAQRG